MIMTSRSRRRSGTVDPSGLVIDWGTKIPPSVSRGGLTVRATRFVADHGRIPFRETTLPGRAGWRGRQPFS